LSRVVLSISVLALTAAALAGCGWRPGGLSLGGSSEASSDTASVTSSVSSGRMSIAGSKPVDAYVLLGGRIKSCWFNADAPLLPNHVYKADVSPDGSKVKITIHQKQALGRPGLATYAIDFKQEGPYTVVTAANRKMTPELAAKMQFDIDRWKRGESNCSKEMPKATAAAPAAAR
jgi:predicted small lipoprotein YifL